MGYNERNAGEDRQLKNELGSALEEYCKSDFYPFHMPGHKRNEKAFSKRFLQELCKVDITEIEGFDNLHEADGILQEAQVRANDLFGNSGSETYFLVNGSSSGNLASICAALYENEEILIARNAHKSVYHAVAMHRLKPRYLLPKEAGIPLWLQEKSCISLRGQDKSRFPLRGRDKSRIPLREQEQDRIPHKEGKIGDECRSGFWGPITAEEVEKQITDDTRAVLITSPTYEGMVSDVKEIADFLHQKQIPLIVDEAHGSHFGLYPTFPESALSCGADLVIHSLHKTLPSLTQTALLHVQGELIDRERVRRYLRVFQSTSPSYPLMASIDSCVCEVKKAGAYRFLQLEKLRNLLEEKTGNLTEVQILPREMIADPCKIVVFSSSKTGRWIADQLRHDYHLEPEMEGEHHVVLILTGYDTSEGIQRLVNAVQGINETAVWEKQKGEERRDGSLGFTEMTKHLPKRRILPSEAWDHKREWKELNESKGSICAEILHVYPPGIPLLVAGEEIDAETILAMKQLLQAGANLQGIRWQEGRVYVPVVKNKPLPNLCLS